MLGGLQQSFEGDDEEKTPSGNGVGGERGTAVEGGLKWSGVRVIGEEEEEEEEEESDEGA